MYDDRDCELIASKKETISPFYMEYKEMIPEQ
ncbi:DUF3885 domain-containing protein [Halalkalibacter wakoensis]|nr:DUF3885 domain-containing protein [Halalkalibacter wakoensis]